MPTIAEQLAELRAAALSRPGYKPPPRRESRAIGRALHISSPAAAIAGPSDPAGGLPCVHRGPKKGVVDCGCLSKPIVFECGNPKVNLTHCCCVRRQPSKAARSIVLDNGDEPLAIAGPLADFVAICAGCPHRQPKA